MPDSLPDGSESRILDAVTGVLRHPGRWRRGMAAVLVTVAVTAGLAIGVLLFHGHTSATGTANNARPFNNAFSGCAAAPGQPAPPPVTQTTNIVEYKVPGLGGIEQVTTGPDGNLWFVGGGGGPSGFTEVVGRITPAGKITLDHPPGNPGMGFDAITAGPDGNVWFTESTADTIGRLVPATGRIDSFHVSLPPPPPSAPPRNTQATSIVAGPDGNLWFDVDQIAGESVMPDGYVGRISPSGTITLFEVPGGAQPQGIQVGADGNLWSRVVSSDVGQGSCGAMPGTLPGYSPGATVIRVTPAGDVSEIGEGSPGFAGYSVGPDHNHWWMTSSGVMRSTTPSGQVANFPAFTSLGFWDPAHFVFGADGNIWYVDGSNIDRMTLAGNVTIYHAPGSNSGATSITAGPDGRLWFVEGASGASTIGALRPPAN